MAKFLDSDGLTHLWAKIKELIPTKTSQLTNDSAFNYSVNATAGTIDALAAFTSGKPGMTGSISLTKKAEGIGSEIPAGWYNFFASPHRTGSTGDNDQYVTIILCPMNFSGDSWILRRSGNKTTISEVKKIATGTIPTKISQLTNDSNFLTSHQDISGKLGAVNKNGLYGIANPDGTDTDWIRTTVNGIIPYQGGGIGSGHGGLGTSTWYFSSAFIDNVHSNKVYVTENSHFEYNNTTGCLEVIT